MSICGVCGERLQPGMGHACSRVYDTRATLATSPRIPAPKTWRELERAAAADGLELRLRPRSVVIATTSAISEPLLSITVGDLTSEDADCVVRRALEGALEALRSLPR